MSWHVPGALLFLFFFNDTAPTEIYTLSLRDALPICPGVAALRESRGCTPRTGARSRRSRSEEHTSELQSRQYLVCRLLLEKQIYSRVLHISVGRLHTSPDLSSSTIRH